MIHVKRALELFRGLFPIGHMENSYLKKSSSGRNTEKGASGCHRRKWHELFYSLHAYETLENMLKYIYICLFIYLNHRIVSLRSYLNIILSVASFVSLYSDHSDKPRLPARVEVLQCEHETRVLDQMRKQGAILVPCWGTCHQDLAFLILQVASCCFLLEMNFQSLDISVWFGKKTASPAALGLRSCCRGSGVWASCTPCRRQRAQESLPRLAPCSPRSSL